MSKILNFLLFFCKSRVFYILVVITVLCELLYTFYANQDLLKQPPITTSDISQFILPPLLLDARQRPRDDFIIEVEKVEKKCGNWEKIMIKDCIKYLDINETDYTVPYYKIEGTLKPPSCVNNKNHEFNEIINLEKENTEQETSSSNLMLFHVFWKGRISDKLILMMKAFIYSQPLNCSKLYVWIDTVEQNLTSSDNMKLLTRFIPRYIELKTWNTKAQLSSIDLFNGWENILTGKKAVSFSDLVRFVVLYKYGGMYVDADVLLLRDMRPFYYSNFEFSYRWSYLNEYNTAVLRLWKNSDIAATIIKGAMKNMMDFHPFKVKSYLLNNKTLDSSEEIKEFNKKLYMLPVGLFDPLWLRNDRRQRGSTLSPNLNQLDQPFFADFIENEFPGVNLTDTEKVTPLSLRKIENFFRGSYGYHWHNNWNMEILPSSWMGVILTACDQFIEGKRRNIYNEAIVPYFP